MMTIEMPRRWRLVFLVTIVAGLLVGLISPAEAQMVCGTRDKIVGHLQQKYGETRRSVGLAQGHGVFEVYASDGGSWTIVLTQPNGKTCLMAAGEAFESFIPEPVKEGA